MLPLPALTFTIPSIHDDTVLDCRVYFPSHFLTDANTQAPWRKKGAIVAHPYAPLGGCYDDPVVEIITSQLLRAEFMVGTFNFRGAGTSKGHTSWTSKAEIKDYTSMIGFMIYLIHGLSRPHSQYHEDSSGNSGGQDYNHLTPVPSQALPPPHTRREISTARSDQNVALDERFTSIQDDLSASSKPSSLFLIAGYSYGALITTQLPNLSSVVELFSEPLVGSAASEIRLRAQKLAQQQNELFNRLAAASLSKSNSVTNKLHAHSVRGRDNQANEVLNSRKVSATCSVRMGGEETDSDLRRASQESHSRHSFAFDTPERVRKSIDRVRSLGGRPPSSEPKMRLPRRQTSSPDKENSASSGAISDTEASKHVPNTTVEAAEKMSLVELGEMKATYLLVSPLQGLVPNLVTLWTTTPSLSSKRKNSKSGESCIDEDKLVTNDTLAVFGDHDIFASTKKLRSWASNLCGAEKSKFMYAEISGAGHFWIEEGVIGKLRGAIGEFVRGL